MKKLDWQIITIAGVAYSNTICYVAYDEEHGVTLKASHPDGMKLSGWLGRPVEVRVADGIIQEWRRL